MPAYAVFVEHFIYPPTQKFVATIKSLLELNFRDRDAYVRGSERPFLMLDIHQCVRHCMSHGEKLMEEHENLEFAACVVPLKLEFPHKASFRQQGLIFVSARNKHGNEWLYAQYVGKVVAPVSVTHTLATTVNEVLEERGTLEKDPESEEAVRAAIFLNLVASGVTHVLTMGSNGLSS